MPTQKLMSNVELFDEFSKCAGVSLHVINNAGIILWASPAVLALLGYRADEYMGQSIEKFHADSGRRKVFMSSLLGGQPLKHHVIPIRSKTGFIEYFEVNASVQSSDPKSLPRRYSCICVTDSVLRRKQQRRGLEKTENGAELLKQLVHRCLNCLSATQGILDWQRQELSELLSGSDMSPEDTLQVKTRLIRDLREYARIAEKALDTQDQVMGDMLALSQLAAGELDCVETPQDVGVLVENALFVMNRKAKENGLTVNAVVTDAARYVKTNRAWFERILKILFSNAVNATGRGCINLSINVLSEEEGMMLEISVSDTGKGMTQEERRGLFGVFAQKDQIFSIGSGVSLRIVKEFLDNVGGALKVDSKKDFGSRFIVTLPCRAVTVEERSTMADRASDSLAGAMPSESKDSFVQIVEDNFISQKPLKELADTAKNDSFDEFLERGAMSLYVIDSEGIVLWANRFALDFLGYRPEEYIGQSIALFHPDSVNNKETPLFLVLGKQAKKHVIPIRCKDGRTEYIEMNPSLPSQERGLGAARYFCTSVTDRVLRVESQRRAIKEKRKANHARAKHEAGFIKQLFRELKGSLLLSRKSFQQQCEQLSQLLSMSSDADLSAEAHSVPDMFKDYSAPDVSLEASESLSQAFIAAFMEHSDAASEAVEHQAAVIQNTLTLFNLEVGQLSCDATPQDLLVLIEYALMSMKKKAEEKGLTVNVLVTDAARVVKTDQFIFEQMIIHLFDHAMKRTTTGHINVNVNVLDGKKRKLTLEISVSDTGHRMTEEERSGLFDVSPREGSTLPSSDAYSGMGLKIVKTFLNKVDGAIRVNCNQDVGSTLVIDLPSAAVTDEERATVVAQEKNAQLASPGLKSKLEILIVDDSIINQKVLSKCCERNGHSCEVAPDGSKALALVEQRHFGEDYRPFDCIIMDVQMPIMGGNEATRKIREREKLFRYRGEVLIIGLSGNSSKQQITESKVAGMDAYLLKPATWEKLNKVIAWVRSTKAPVKEELVSSKQELMPSECPGIKRRSTPRKHSLIARGDALLLFGRSKPSSKHYGIASRAVGGSGRKTFIHGNRSKGRGGASLRKKTLKQRKEPVRLERVVTNGNRDGDLIRDLDVRPDGNCFYYALVLALLLPHVGKPTFNLRAIKVFGGLTVEGLVKLQEVFSRYDGSRDYLNDASLGDGGYADNSLARKIANEFRGRVVKVMRDAPEVYRSVDTAAGNDELSPEQFNAYLNRQDQEGTHAGDTEMVAVEKLLGVRIEVHRMLETTKKSLTLDSKVRESERADGQLLRLLYTSAKEGGAGQENHYHLLLHPEHLPTPVPKPHHVEVVYSP